MKNYYLGIDAGGTSYDIISVNPEGRINFKVKKNALHYNNTVKKNFANHLSKEITNTLEKKKLLIKDCKGICIGVAGARHKRERDELINIIRKNLKFIKIAIETDTEIARYGAFGGENGIILICGTGSVLYGKIKDKSYRIGGWGKIIGDEGSGYKIGLEAIRILAKEFDLNKINSSLAKILKVKFRITNENLVEKIYRKDFNIQKITPLILELALKKNKPCQLIIQNAVLELAELINRFFILSKKRMVELVLFGSLITKNNYFSEVLKSEINKKFGKRITLSESKHSAEYGAYLIAKNKFK